MTAVKITRSKSSLSRKMAVPGGRTVQEALDLAAKGLESHREAGMATLAERLSWLETAVVERAPHKTGEIYLVAAELLDLAGFFETGPLYQAIFSLCDIADRMNATNIWDWPSIDVHVRAMRLILSDGCKVTATSTTILQGLEAVARRVS